MLPMSKLRRLLTLIFGNISWQPPGWLREHRRAVVWITVLTLLASAGGWFGYDYYRKLPKPRTVAVSVDPPPVTKLEKELKPRPLLVRFDDSAARLDLIGKPLSAGVRVEPAIEGTWRWTGDRCLELRPAQDWPAEKKYRITIDKSILAPRVLLTRHVCDVETPKFSASLKKLEFYQDPNDPAVKQVVATLEFTHSVAQGELEKRVSLAMLGGSQVFKQKQAPLFSVSFGPHHRIAYVRSLPLALPEREDFMRFTLGKGVATSQGGATTKEDIQKKIRIPNIYSFFKIDSVEGEIVRKSNGEPEQILVVKTTAGAKSEDIAKALEIYLLPKKKPAKDDTDAQPGSSTEEPASRDEPKAGEESDDDNTEDADADDHNDEEKWGSPREVDAGVLKSAKPVKFTLVPSKQENSKEHTFKINVEQNGSLYFKIRKGVRAPGDFALGEDYDAIVPVPALPREIEIQGEGGVLALSGERKLSIRSRGVPVIEYTIARVPADQINHLVSQTSGDFQNPEFACHHFDETNIARIATEKQPIAITNKFQSNYSSFDFANHLRPANDGGSPMQGLFFIKARGWNPTTKKYLREISATRFILVTDIGLLVKENADDSRDIFLQSLSGREPLAGVAVDILAKNGVPLVSGSTGADGRIHFPSHGRAERERRPVAIVARNGSDVAFIPYAREDRKLDFSRFDVDGIENVSASELDAFVFTERGVYRPGDEMHVAFTVKQRDWGGKLAGLPLETEVVDARGTIVQEKKLALPESGFAEFTYKTAYESPTGEYGINIYLIRNGKHDTLLGSARAVVKEFLPDRMKITSRLSKSGGGWVDPKDIRAFVELRNLYGTPATERRIKARMQLSPGGFRFDEYKDYSFFDRLREKQHDIHCETVDLGEKTTDDKGGAEFDLNLERFASATYAVTFFAEGFEAEGGRSVNTTSALLVSAQPFVVGHKADGDLRYVKMNSDRAIEFIAIDGALKKVAVENLQLRVIEQSYVSVLTKEESGSYVYESVLKERTTRSDAVSISAGGTKFALPTDAPGNYVLELLDTTGGCVSRLSFSVVGLGKISRSLDKNAELQVKLDREQYKAGDEIEISITAPYTGSGLITIERDKVYAHQWFQAGQTSSVQRIRLPEGFDGTGYVNVSFIRALDSKEIFMSPLSYGVVPFTANRERRKLKIDLEAVTKARPGEPLKIGYKTDRPAKIVVFAVDQGILQVTNYELPNPLGYYFRKAALKVGTSQIVDLVLPEYSLLRSSAFGGDGEARQLNPFKRVTEKPVVFWSGVIDADSTRREVTYDVPDYFSGTLTVMAVAISPDAVGSAERNALIRGSFVITPGVPTLAAPGDKFEVGVTIANNVEGSGENAEIALKVEPSVHLEILKSPTMPLRIAEGREATVTFTVRTKEALGSASLLFAASAGGQESRLRSTLSVRPAVAFMTEVRSGNFKKETVELPVTRSMHPEFRKLEAVVSALPLGLAHGLDAYLKNYPNGCSEQLTSGAFCRLMLSDEADFGLTRAEVNAQLEKTFSVLRRRQNDQGAFGYWACEKNDGVDFISAYVMHFLIEAKASGFAPPTDVFKSGLLHLQQMVVKEPRDLAEARTIAYSIYLLTREEVVTTNYILNLRDYLDKKCAKQWQGDLTSVYLAGAWSILKKNDEAQKLIRTYRIGVHDPHERSDFHQPLGTDAQYIAIIARHFPEMLKQVTAADFQNIVGPVSEGKFNTLSAAYAVVALKSYSQHIAASPPELRITEITKQKSETNLPADGRLLKRAAFSPNAASLRFGAKPQVRGMGAFYQVVETGFDAGLPEKSISDGLEVYREYLDKAGRVTGVARLGEPVKVRLRIRSLNAASISNVAIVDLLPGGFEVVGSTLQPGAGQCGVDYVEVREDRAVFFTGVGTNVREITYQIKPCNRGEFVVPPVFAESMYDRAIKARGLAGKITVEDAK